jgi:hypothetical protein
MTLLTFHGSPQNTGGGNGKEAVVLSAVKPPGITRMTCAIEIDTEMSTPLINSPVNPWIIDIAVAKNVFSMSNLRFIFEIDVPGHPVRRRGGPSLLARG